VCAIPKPYQKPHPPLASRRRRGVVRGRRTPRAADLPGGEDVEHQRAGELRRPYHAAWREAGHRGRGEVAAILPVYVAETERAAREETEASAMHFFAGR